MTLPFGRRHGLVPRGGAGLTCDEEGLALGPIPLAVITEGQDGRRLCRLRSFAQIEKALDLAYGARLDRPIGRYCSGFQRIAELIQAGDRGRADLHAVLLGLPPIQADGMAKLAGAEDLKKAGDAWQGESRVSAGEDGAGEWTDGGGGAGEAQLEPAAARAGPLQLKKTTFVKAYLANAQAAARVLGVPVENILGVSALESNWAGSRFAKKGNNLFGMYYPAPLAYDSIPAIDNPKALLSKYKTVSDSFASFVENINRS